MTNPVQFQLNKRQAEAYQRWAEAGFLSALAGRLAESARLREGERVLDVACGTGLVAREAAGRVGADGSVAGADLNAGMLAVAERLSPSITWHECDASELPFDAAAFDVVLCQQGLQFFTEPQRALGEMRRVLGERGRLVVSVWPPIEENAFLRERVRALVPFVTEEPPADPISPLHEGGALESAIRAAGFSDVRVVKETAFASLPVMEEFVPLMYEAVPAGVDFLTLDEAQQQSAIEHLKSALAEYAVPGGFEVPFVTNVAFALK
jgi:SAM-dependent methyltransferase